MNSIYIENRKTGISVIGGVPWGTHFCQFYNTDNDLLGIFVPYFKAGLENNERCIWISFDSGGADDAKKALKKSLLDFEKYAAKGQIKVISYKQWNAGRTNYTNAIVSRLDKAILSGFDGLRLGYNYPLKNKNSNDFCCPDAIARYNVIALSAFHRDSFNTLELMDVVKNYEFALVRNINRWEVIESSGIKRARDALKHTEEKLHSLFSNMSEGFAYHRIVLDERGKPCDYIFLETNAAFEKLIGLRGKKIIGKRATEVLHGIEKEPADLIGKYGKVALTGEPLQFEHYSELFNRWYAVSSFSPHKGYFAITLNDITERRQVKEIMERDKETLEKIIRERSRELIDAQSELGKTKRLSDIGTLAATVAHELRNPLAVINMAVSNIKRKAGNPLLDKHIVTIEKKVLESEQIINNLLYYSRIRPPVYENININLIINDCAAELLQRQILSKKEISIKMELNLTKDISIDADPLQIKEVLINILNNACDAVGDSTGKINIRTFDEEEFIGISIMDNGAGIYKQHLEKVFDPFFTTKPKGTGLGLSVCKQIIQLHRGTIQIESESGKGTKVSISLPKKEGKSRS